MSDRIIGIDLGTTNSEVAIVRDGRPVVLEGEEGPLLPSAVGLDEQGELLVGHPARNQAAYAPDRTVLSIKRKMGTNERVELGETSYSPQEISSLILGALKARAEAALGESVHRAVITVPAYFTDQQRQATLEAGRLAGLKVERILNEPTAAALAYQPDVSEQRQLLVYDLGGGTFDVSIVQAEAGVMEVKASHGDTQLGGDDMDQRLIDHVLEAFKHKSGVSLRTRPTAYSRLREACETAKKTLSDEAFATLREPFIAEKAGKPLNLEQEIEREKYESLIDELVRRTFSSVDQALDDAGLTAVDLDGVLLVGGATRTPLVQRLLEERLGQPAMGQVQPDLCVALGAAVQAAIIEGQDVGAVLVDITPRTLGVRTLHPERGHLGDASYFTPVVPRNTPLPARRSQLFSTVRDGQTAARIEVFQGESEDVRQNVEVGSFMVNGLANVEAGNQLLVRFELSLDGTLNVTAIERRTGLQEAVTLESAISRFQADEGDAARQRLHQLTGTTPDASPDADAEDAAFYDGNPDAVETDPHLAAAVARARPLREQAQKLLAEAEHESERSDLAQAIAQLDEAITAQSAEQLDEAVAALDDTLFYLGGT